MRAIGYVVGFAVPVGCFLLITSAGFSSLGTSLRAEEPSGKPLFEEVSPEEERLVKDYERRRIETIRKVVPTVIAVFGKDREQGGGSGVIIHPSGWAVTNHHVVANSPDGGLAGLPDGRLVPWTLGGIDPAGDLALIHLEDQREFPFATLGDSDQLRAGAYVFTAGNPFALAEDFSPSISLGIVSGLNRYKAEDPNGLWSYPQAIQVDSAVNPGNSGGPLFDVRSQIVGINGLASFGDRGRVGVGVGYAIPSKQIERFLPELFAGKIARHGSLDAIFSTTPSGVICQTIDLDGPLGRAGMSPGDRLIAIEGVEIQQANQALGLVAALPADWPTSVRFESRGKRLKVVVRLSPVNVEVEQTPPPPKEIPPDESPEKKPDTPDKDENSPNPAVPDATPNPIPPDSPPNPAPPSPEPALVIGPDSRSSIWRLTADNQGVVADQNRNERNAAWLFESISNRTRRRVGQNGEVLRCDEDLTLEGRPVGIQTWYLSSEGAWRLDVAAFGESPRSWSFDGEAYWEKSPDSPWRTVTKSRALRDPFALGVAIYGALACQKLETAFGPSPTQMILNGVDKANRGACARLEILAEKEDSIYAWIRLFNASGELKPQIEKVGMEIHETEDSNLQLLDWREMEGHFLPQSRIEVAGLSEQPRRVAKLISVESLPQADSNLFRPIDP